MGLPGKGKGEQCQKGSGKMRHLRQVLAGPLPAKTLHNLQEGRENGSSPVSFFAVLTFSLQGFLLKKLGSIQKCSFTSEVRKYVNLLPQ